MKRIVAINDSVDYCSLCGKEELKRVVWIEDTDTCEVSHYGVVCASRVMGWNKKETVKKMNKKAEEMKKEWDNAFYNHPKVETYREMEKLYFDFFKDKNRIDYCKSLGLTPLIHFHKEVDVPYGYKRSEITEEINKQMGYRIEGKKIIML